MSAARRKARQAAVAFKNPPRPDAKTRGSCDTRKRRYRTKLDALTAASSASASSGKGRRLRPYFCRICGGWHLTSQPKRAQS